MAAAALTSLLSACGSSIAGGYVVYYEALVQRRTSQDTLYSETIVYIGSISELKRRRQLSKCDTTKRYGRSETMCVTAKRKGRRKAKKILEKRLEKRGNT